MSEVGASCKGDPRHPAAVLSQPLLALVLPVVIPSSHHLRRVPRVPGGSSRDTIRNSLARQETNRPPLALRPRTVSLELRAA